MPRAVRGPPPARSPAPGHRPGRSRPARPGDTERRPARDGPPASGPASAWCRPRAFRGLANGVSPASLALGVHPVERGPWQKDLTPHFDVTRHFCLQRQRNATDGAHVGGDVLSAHAIATRHPTHEQAVPVVQGDAQPVDLQLGDIGHRRTRIQIQPLPHSIVERGQLRLVVGVVQAEHRDGMVHRRKAIDRAGRRHAGWESGGSRARDEQPRARSADARDGRTRYPRSPDRGGRNTALRDDESRPAAC